MTKTPATDHYQDQSARAWLMDEQDECFQCGGDGFVFECFDGFCEAAEEGCDDCTRPCPVCARPVQP